MGDINQTEAGQSVFISDGTSNEKAAVKTVTPSSGDAAVAVREVERGQKDSDNSIPVVMADDYELGGFGNNIIAADGRLRVANPLVKASDNFSRGITAIWDVVVNGAGSATHDTDDNAAVLNTGGTSASDDATMQTVLRFTHSYGITSQVVMAATIGAKKLDVLQRIGFYDSDDGFFFEQNLISLKVVRRSSATGSVVDDTVAQASWNLDTLDGTGPSGVTIDTSKIQNFLIEFEHAGGIARFGFRIGGRVIYCHQFESGNFLQIPLTAWSVLPIRISIDNTGVAASATQIRLYSFSVLEEGSSLSTFPVKTANLGTDIFSVGDTFDVPVMSLRLKSSFSRAAFLPVAITVLIVNNADTLVKIWLGVSLTGASWVSNSDTVELDTSATAFSGGEVRTSFYITTNESIRQDPSQRFGSGGVSSLQDGTSVIVTMTAAKIGSNGNMLSTMDYGEIS